MALLHIVAALSLLLSVSTVLAINISCTGSGECNVDCLGTMCQLSCPGVCNLTCSLLLNECHLICNDASCKYMCDPDSCSLFVPEVHALSTKSSTTKKPTSLPYESKKSPTITSAANPQVVASVGSLLMLAFTAFV